MCGICGFSGVSNKELLQKMGGILSHRGPDDEGVYHDGKINLCARRLSIVDIQKGFQPVANETKEIWVVWNGEIYNAPELRLALEAKGHAFHSTHSDTELIPHLYEEYGPDFTSVLNGMFAIALWDKNNQSLILYRDRMGVKPLFYTVRNGEIVFGSEIKSILAYPGIDRTLNPGALYEYFSFKNTCAPETIYRDIRQLMPGTMLFFKNREVSERRYWKVDFSRKCEDSFAVAVEKTRELLRDSVRIRMRADVKVGAFLSGGLDSSLVSAMSSEYIGEGLQTFTLGHEINNAKLHDKDADVTFAKALSAQLKTEHRVHVMRPSDVVRELSNVMVAFDEPFSGPISTYFLSKFMSVYVKTAVSGDGADELFGGYLPHLLAFPMQHITECVALGKDPFLEFEKLKPFDGSRAYLQALYDCSKGNEAVISNQMLPSSDEMRGVFLNVDIFGEFVRSQRTLTKIAKLREQGCAGDPCNRALEQDLNLILPNQVLAYEDRLSMAHSLEIRSPFMDYRLIEYVTSLPGTYKVCSGESKYLLKKVAEGILPTEMIYRPKQGFVMPIHDWMQNELREFVCDTLSSESLKNNEYLVAPAVSYLMDTYFGNREGNVQLADILWNLTSFICWYENVHETNHL
jgi:asparagine synthase (glutamine-hydrolysing)